MFIKQSPVALRPITIIFMLVMLLFATVADAATCGSEFVSSGAAEMAASSLAQEEASSNEKKHDGQSSRAEQHGICGHGHCHVGSNISETAHIDHIGHPLTLHGPTDSAFLVSGENILLKRPPRI